MTNSELAIKIIRENTYLSLATGGGDKVWITPLFFAEDKEFNFYCVSEKKSLHSQNLKKNSKVAVAIFNSTIEPGLVNGLQIEAEAYEVGIKEILHAAKTIYQKRFKGKPLVEMKKYLSKERYMGIGEYRLYKIVPKKVFMLDPKRVGKSGRDVRIEVELN